VERHHPRRRRDHPSHQRQFPAELHGSENCNNETLPSKDSGVLKPVALFQIPADLCPAEPGVKYRLADTPVAMTMAKRIATGLAEKRYSVSKVGPGSGGGAGFACRLGQACEITVFLGVERREGDSICFFLMTWQTSSLIGRFLGRGAKTPDCDKRWGALCQAINDVLGEIFSGVSVVWQTEEEDRGAECR